MNPAQISPDTFQFLGELAENNNREWFQANKSRYEQAHENVLSFTEELMERMKDHDHLVDKSPKKSLRRIYRDVRFSKDKSPYKSNFSGGMTRATKLLRGGYYFRLQPAKSLIAGGFFSPNTEDLARIRRAIGRDEKPLRRIVAASRFQKHFGMIIGEKVRTSPKGYNRDHPAIDLIRLKQFIVEKPFSDELVLSEHFLDEAIETYLAMRPYFDYMSEILTTNENGELIV